MASKMVANRGQFQKGRAKTGGRRKGIANKATRAKDFVSALVSDPDQQQALAEAIQKHPELLFKAAEHAHGRPHQTLAQEVAGPIEIRWQDELVERLQNGRKRVVEAREGQEDA